MGPDCECLEQEAGLCPRGLEGPCPEVSKGLSRASGQLTLAPPSSTRFLLGVRIGVLVQDWLDPPLPVAACLLHLQPLDVTHVEQHPRVEEVWVGLGGRGHSSEDKVWPR